MKNLKQNYQSEGDDINNRGTRNTVSTTNTNSTKSTINTVKFENNNDIDEISKKYLKCRDDSNRATKEIEQIKKLNSCLNDENARLAINLKQIEMIVKNEVKQDPKQMINQIKKMFGDEDLLESISIISNTNRELMRRLKGQSKTNFNVEDNKDNINIVPRL